MTVSYVYHAKMLVGEMLFTGTLKLKYVLARNISIEPLTPLIQVFPLPVEGAETKVLADDQEVANYMINLGDLLETVRFHGMMSDKSPDIIFSLKFPSFARQTPRKGAKYIAVLFPRVPPMVHATAVIHGRIPGKNIQALRI